MMNVKTYVCAFLALAISLSAYGQNPTFEWIKQMGGSGFNVGFSVDLDPQGNTYVTGFFDETVDFDPGPGVVSLSAPAGSNVFIQKLDTNGNLLWVKEIGGSQPDIGKHIAVAPNGDVIIVGYFSGTVDFDPGIGVQNKSATGVNNSFIVKLDASGNYLWSQTLDVGTVNSVVTDADGNIILGGNFGGTVDFDPGPGSQPLTAVGQSDIYLLQLAASGQFNWAKRIEGVLWDHGDALAVDTSGNVYTTGRFAGTGDFDPGPGTQQLTAMPGVEDVFVLKLDQTGDFVWAKQLAGNTNAESAGIAINESGELYITGTFGGTVDFDPGAGQASKTAVGQIDMFTLKLDVNGTYDWAKVIAGVSRTSPYSIATDALGRVYTTGVFNQTVDFNPGPGADSLTATGFDMFIHILDNKGDYVWAGHIGGGFSEIGWEIALNAQQDIYIVGDYSGTVDFDPDPTISKLTPSVGQDIFIQKLDQCIPLTRLDVITSCEPYTWIDGNTYTKTNKSAQLIIPGATPSGCDSIIALDLTIGQHITRTDVVTSCGPYTWIDGKTYPNSDSTASVTFVGATAIGCDSTITLDLTVNRVSDLTLSVNAQTLTANNNNATSYQWLDCNNNFQPIVGATNQTFTATVNGQYAVAISENGCVDTSACESITSVNLESQAETSISLHPNPTTGTFVLTLGSTLPIVSIRILDMQGRVVHTSQHRHTDRIELTLDAAPGMYLVVVNQEAFIPVITID